MATTATTPTAAAMTTKKTTKTRRRRKSWSEDDDDDPHSAYFGDARPDAAGSSSSALRATQPREHQVESTLARKANLGEAPSMSHKARTAMTQVMDTGRANRAQGRDDRATTEMVMDPRTRLVLFKMLNKGLLQEIHGCVSTGKEANVYHATDAEGKELAVKVFKTSILVFKDRDKYVSGDFRFRSGYGKSNPRKMVSAWAEKELRNLNRIWSAGIPCPQPIELRSNVLVMEFLGEDGWPAPRLKDADVDEDRMRALYLQCIRHMRVMFQTCRLVHGDLSEYNMLYLRRKLYIIDVSQAVELDHPRALDFLRVDCVNVTRFFATRRDVGVQNALSARALFEFVTDPALGVDEVDMDTALAKLEEKAMHATEEDSVRDKVFMETHVPRSLQDVEDHEDLNAKVAAERDDVLAQAIANLTSRGTVAIGGARHEDDDEGDAEDDDESNDDSESDEDEDGDHHTEDDDQAPAAFSKRNATKEERKAHKSLVKAERREKIKDKIKKKDKKQLVKKKR